MTRRLSELPGFRPLRDRLAEIQQTRLPKCDRCGEEVEIPAWSLHRQQLCPGRESTTPAGTSGQGTP